MQEDDTLKWATAAAIQNHLGSRKNVALTLTEIQDIVFEWPTPRVPAQVVREALELLEEMEVVLMCDGRKEPTWRSIWRE